MILQKISVNPYMRANERYPYLTQEIQNRTIEILAKIIAEKDGIDPERLDRRSKIKRKVFDTCDTFNEK